MESRWKKILLEEGTPASPFLNWGDWGNKAGPPLPFLEFIQKDLGEPELSETQKYIAKNVLGPGGETGDPVLFFDKSSRPLMSILYLGKGSGKGFMAMNMMTWVIYMLHWLPSPPMEYFSLSSSDNFSIVLVATNRSQAGTSMERLVNRLLRSKFFNRFPIIKSGKLLNKTTAERGWPEIHISVGVNGEGIVKFTAIGLGVRVVPSKNESFEGLTLIGWVMDEASGFVSDKGLFNANQIFGTLSTSVRELPYLGLVTSFPRRDAESDFTHQLFLSVVGTEDGRTPLRREGFSEDKRVWAITRYTWEVKPRRLYSGETFVFSFPDVGVENVEIPIEYKREFEQDPYNAIAKYMCIPVGYAVQKRFAPLILKTTPEQIHIPAEELRYTPPLLLGVEEPGVVEIVSGGETRKLLRYPVGLVRASIQPSFLRTTQFLMGIDAGESDCSAVIAVGHPVLQEGKPPLLVIDQIITYTPVPRKRIFVDLMNFFHMVVHVSKVLGIRHVKSDQWQTSPFRYTVEHWDNRPVSRADYTLAREMLYNGLLRFARLEDAKLFLEQFRTLVDTNERSKPRTTQSYQDVADAVVGVVFWLKELYQLDVSKIQSGEYDFSVVREVSERRVLPTGEVGQDPHETRIIRSSPFQPFIQRGPAVGSGYGPTDYPNAFTPSPGISPGGGPNLDD